MIQNDRNIVLTCLNFNVAYECPLKAATTRPSTMLLQASMPTLPSGKEA